MTTTLAPSAARPRLFQFTLSSLLMAMAWVGLVSLALARPTEFWSGAIFLLTLLLLLGIVLVAVYRTGRTRAFAIGFLVFGAGYLLCLTLVAGSLAGALRQGWTPVSGASAWLFEKVHPPKTVQQPAVPGMMGGFGGMGPGMPGGMMGSADGGMAGPGGMGGGMYGGEGGGMPGPRGYASSYTVQPYEPQNFALVCNLAVSCLVGVLGGIIAQWLFATRRQAEGAGT